MIRQKEARVIFNETEPLYVWADEFKTEEVVTNYVSNALHHLDGEKIVEIKVQKQENRVKVTVFNTGTPIPGSRSPESVEQVLQGRQSPHQRVWRKRNRTFYCKGYYGRYESAVRCSEL